MTEAVVQVEAPKDGTRKKKSKRSSSNRKEAGMSSSAGRISSSRSSRDRDNSGELPPRRRRSKSTDRLRPPGTSTVPRSQRVSAAAATASTNGDVLSTAAANNSRSSTVSGSSGSRKASPRRSRKPQSEGSGQEARKDRSGSDTMRNSPTTSSGAAGGATGTPLKDHSQSKSPLRFQSTEAAPRPPQRSTSGTSDLHTALEATKNRMNSKTGGGGSPSNNNNNNEEASLGDFKKYTQQQQQKSRSRFGNISKMMESKSSKMGDIPENSLGSFTAFAKKYEQEELMGLHDEDHDSYLQKEGTELAAAAATIAPYNHEQSVSLGGLLNPMQQYGGTAPKTPTAAMVDESLGSFAAFNQKYEHDKLIGLHDSTMSGLPPVPERKKEVPKPNNIPEESMGDFVQHSAAQDAHINKKEERKSKRRSNDGEEKEKEHAAIVIPSSRIEKLGKRGGVGYKIMVDSPGGHAREQMNIVVAIGFEDDSDSDDEDAELRKESLEGPASQAEDGKDGSDQDNDIDDSSHLPMSEIEEDKLQRNKKLQSFRPKQELAGNNRSRKMKNWHANDDTVDDDDDGSEDEKDEDQARPLGRWREQVNRIDPEASRPPERERSRSGHSASTGISSVTLESVLEKKIHIQADNCPSNQHFRRKPPGFKSKNADATGLRRTSGVVRKGGTASLLKLAPHNLGTRRGMMLRQQSQASMMSTKSSKSTDSSWVDPNHDIPDNYEASFMQLNLLDMEKTEMQTNQEVDKAELPKFGQKEVLEIDPNENIAVPGPSGKDPQKASTELLGMKTMLKHIKRAAPLRSKSFDFDKDMPKQIWNSMFARSKKGELPGSQYLDQGDNSIEDLEVNTGNQEVDDEANETEAQAKAISSATAGLFNTLLGRSSAVRPLNSGKDSSPEQAQEQAQDVDKEENRVDDVADDDGGGGDDDEGSIEIEELGESVEEDLEEDQDNNDPGDVRVPSSRRRSGDKTRELSTRSGRSTRVTDVLLPKKGGPTRNRAARGQNMHNRSLVDTLDFLTTEQEAEEGVGPKNDIDDSKKRTNRARARRKIPKRTKSDDTTGRGMPSRARSSEGANPSPVHRTRSQESGSALRAAERNMNKSFSVVDPGDGPSRPKAAKANDSNNASAAQPANEFRDMVKKMQSSFSGVDDPEDLPVRPVRAKKSKDAPARTKSHDKGASSSRPSGRKPRPQRKKATETPEVPDNSGLARGLELPKDATETELRNMLGYDE